MYSYTLKIIKVDDINYLVDAFLHMMFNRKIYKEGNEMKHYISSNFKKKCEMI